MLYRSNSSTFNNFKNKNKKGKIKLFIVWDNNMQANNKIHIKRDYYKNSFLRQIDSVNEKEVKVGFISGKYNKKGCSCPTQGFGVLINLIEKTKYKK